MASGLAMAAWPGALAVAAKSPASGPARPNPRLRAASLQFDVTPQEKAPTPYTGRHEVVEDMFRDELQRHGDRPEYRIGIWRVH